MVKIDVRPLWPALVALLLAAAIPGLVLPESRANRAATLDLEVAGFDERYIQFRDTERTRAAIVSRGLTTTRRGETPEQPVEWSMQALESGGWMARSAEEGVLFFVPVTEVSDWVYPFVHSFVREHHKGLELPRAEWTTVYVDRLYEGLFLRVSLPFDRPDASQGRRELLLVDSGGVMSVDTWFDSSADRFEALEGLEVEPRHASLAWLSTLSSETATTLVLSRRPTELSLMPLPVSLRRLYSEVYGVAPAFREDEQAPAWSGGWRERLAETTFPTDDERPVVDAEFAEYRALFLSALEVHGDFHGATDQLRASLPERQHAGVELGLTLNGS